MRKFRHQDSIAAAAVGHLDSGETLFFARELETVEAKVYEVKYPELKSRSILPAFTGLDPTDEFWTITQADYVGGDADGNGSPEAHPDSDEMPGVELHAAQRYQKVAEIHQGYEFSLHDIQAANRVGRPLDVMKAMGARKLVERRVDYMLAYGSKFASSNGMLGILNQTKIDVLSTTASGAKQLPAGAAGTGNIWGPGANGCTPKEILAQLNFARNYMVVGTNEVHTPNALRLDTASMAYISTTPCSQADANFAGSVMTILQYIRANAPWLQTIESWNRCNTKDGTSNGKARSMLYERNEENGAFCVPLEYQTSAPQLVGFKFKIPGRARCAGVNIRYPKGFVYLDGFQG